MLHPGPGGVGIDRGKVDPIVIGLAEVGARVRRGAVLGREHEEVGARAARQRVAPAPAGQRIGSGPAGERIGTAAFTDHGRFAAAGEGVGASAASERQPSTDGGTVERQRVRGAEFGAIGYANTVLGTDNDLIVRP